MNSGQYGGGPGGGRYNAGRVPQGVEFLNMPGRASTPLPTSTADKQAERIAQLEIWNRAVTNQDGDGGAGHSNLTTRARSREMSGGGPGGGSGGAGAPQRRTDAYSDARNRHNASFQGPSSHAAPVTANEIFADFDDDDSGDDEDERRAPPETEAPPPAAEPPPQPKPEPVPAPATKPDESAQLNGSPPPAEAAKDPRKGGCCTIQ